MDDVMTLFIPDDHQWKSDIVTSRGPKIKFRDCITFTEIRHINRDRLVNTLQATKTAAVLVPVTKAARWHTHTQIQWHYQEVPHRIRCFFNSKVGADVILTLQCWRWTLQSPPAHKYLLLEDLMDWKCVMCTNARKVRGDRELNLWAFSNEVCSSVTPSSPLASPPSVCAALK